MWCRCCWSGIMGSNTIHTSNLLVTSAGFILNQWMRVKPPPHPISTPANRTQWQSGTFIETSRPNWHSDTDRQIVHISDTHRPTVPVSLFHLFPGFIYRCGRKSNDLCYVFYSLCYEIPVDFADKGRIHFAKPLSVDEGFLYIRAP